MKNRSYHEWNVIYLSILQYIDRLDHLGGSKNSEQLVMWLVCHELRKKLEEKMLHRTDFRMKLHPRWEVAIKAALVASDFSQCPNRTHIESVCRGLIGEMDKSIVSIK